MPDSFGLCGALMGVFALFMVSAFILALLGGTVGNEGDPDPDYPPPGTPPQGHARTALPVSRGNLAPAPLSGGRKHDAQQGTPTSGESATAWHMRYASWIPPPRPSAGRSEESS